jgi:hypothetical protein
MNSVGSIYGLVAGCCEGSNKRYGSKGDREFLNELRGSRLYWKDTAPWSDLPY